MDALQFDRLVAGLAQTPSRRRLVRSLVPTLVSLLGGSRLVAAEKKNKKKHHKKHKKPKDHCADGETNFGETDIDCGGPCSRKCSDRQSCAVDADCSSGLCATRHPGIKQCGDCRLDTDCFGDLRCIDHFCEQCAADFDCTPVRPFCVVTPACPNGKPCECVRCRQDTDCTTTGQPHCCGDDCRECCDDVDCPAGAICDETNTCFHCGSAQGIGVEGCSCVPDGELCTPGTDSCCEPSSTCVLRDGRNICFD